MDKQIRRQQILNKPNYKKIFEDIISRKFSSIPQHLLAILEKDDLSMLDVLKINQLIVEATEKKIKICNHKHRAYDEETIKYILDYQIEKALNNTQLASHFKLSRNTVTKWKKMIKLQQN